MNRRLARAIASACLLLQSEAIADERTPPPDEASTEQIERCVSQHDSAKQLRAAEHWLEARAALTACATDRCPLAINADCRVWLDDLNRELPTLLIFAEAEDGLSRPSRVELDGQALTLSEPPAPIELVPGPHRLRVTFAGNREVERTFELKRGEKNHVERVRVPPLPAPKSAPALPVQAAPPAATRPVPTLTYLFSAGALGAFGSSTAWLVSALREHNEARATCAPTCEPTVRKSIEKRLVLADVSAGVGISLGVLAVYSYLRRPTVKGEAPRSGPVVLAGPSAVSLTWQGNF
jgi:hypothetical protein